MTKRLIFNSIFAFFFYQGFAQTNGDILFDNTTIHELRITSATEPDLYGLLQDDVDTPNDRPYYPVTMEFDGEKIDSVGVRVKGISPANRIQVPMKIDINEFVSGQEFDGMKKLNLTNSYEDEYRQKDRLSYELFRRAGVPAPRTSYVEVYVNDVFINVYLLVQQIDKTFIKDHFADAGSLAKYGTSTGTELKYGNDVFGNLLSPFEVNEQLLDMTYLRNYLKFVLINEIIFVGDNYPINNFYSHFSEKGNLFHFLPWDYNFTFLLSGSAGDIRPRWAELDIIWNTPEYKELYLELACEFNEYLLEEDYINKLIDDNEATILSNSQGVTVADPDFLRTYLSDRRVWLQEQLIAEGVTCNGYTYPLNIGDLVINEFVAASDSIGGIQEPDGGTPDWIELYNNTNNDIIIDERYYLSDDIDFPKKWNFKSEITIPANDYLILWADKDIHQQGLHTNFKISKSEGNLLLIYEDMTIIDQLSYGSQELNKAYARVPNGSGDFIIQDPTFDANNEAISSSSDNTAVSAAINVYPNPVNDVINITQEIPVSKLSVYSISGKLLLEEYDNMNKVNVASLPPGMYLLNIKMVNGNEVIFKFYKN